MIDSPIVVLVIEDDQLDFKLLGRSLRDCKNIKLIWESTLAKGLKTLALQKIDVVILDLSLPDSTGLDTIDSIARQSPIPIVVMSNTKDEDVALQAVRHGAQDYLFKDQMDPLLLSRTLRYAVERYSLLSELHSARQIARRDTELQRLKTDKTLEHKTNATANVGSVAFKDAYPNEYEKISSTYQELLRHLMGRREYQVRPMNVSEVLKELAHSLGLGGATPHDAIGIHTVSVREVLEQLPEQKNELCHQEARYLLSGMLGHLCYYYRDHPVNQPEQVSSVERMQ